MIRDTSIEAYEEIKDTLNPREGKVFDAIVWFQNIKGRGPTDREILVRLRWEHPQDNWEITDVTARRNGLLDKSLVLPGKKVPSQRRRNLQVYTWELRHGLIKDTTHTQIHTTC